MTWAGYATMGLTATWVVAMVAAWLYIVGVTAFGPSPEPYEARLQRPVSAFTVTLVSTTQHPPGAATVTIA